MKIGFGSANSEVHKVSRTEGADEVEYRSVCGDPIVQTLVSDGQANDVTCSGCKAYMGRQEREFGGGLVL